MFPYSNVVCAAGRARGPDAGKPSCSRGTPGHAARAKEVLLVAQSAEEVLFVAQTRKVRH